MIGGWDIPSIIAAAIGAGVLLWLLRAVLRLLRKPQKLPVIGGEELLYQDSDNAPFLANKAWGVGAKPDHIIREGEDVIVVENKGREKGPYESDWAQARFGALAARGAGYPVSKVRWVNGKRRVTKRIPASDADLFETVRPLYEQVVAVRNGEPVRFRPKAAKCRSCYLRNSCDKRAV
ncbi:PD-(D/E)XK nuclease family protein [Thioalkalivibrio sp. ALE16]|uniref:PD-(D/E)XK nuclease family protein n=1 Tax=Thioalkalivibrio sp. ALE16 TaxID=1158172 RepID=UPI0003687333|nr:PD-(D/E)XK nuclease family protein [Thioalkalivibrio sp. ALE16]